MSCTSAASHVWRRRRSPPWPSFARSKTRSAAVIRRHRCRLARTGPQRSWRSCSSCGKPNCRDCPKNPGLPKRSATPSPRGARWNTSCGMVAHHPAQHGSDLSIGAQSCPPVSASNCTPKHTGELSLPADKAAALSSDRNGPGQLRVPFRLRPTRSHALCRGQVEKPYCSSS